MRRFSPLLRGRGEGETGPRVGRRRRACYKSTFIYQRGGRREKEKSSLLVPRKKQPPLERGAFLPLRWGWRAASGANMKGKRPPSPSRQFFSSLLITDTSFRFRSSEPWSLEERKGERMEITKTIVIPLAIAEKGVAKRSIRMFATFSAFSEGRRRLRLSWEAAASYRWISTSDEGEKERYRLVLVFKVSLFFFARLPRREISKKWNERDFFVEFAGGCVRGGMGFRGRRISSAAVAAHRGRGRVVGTLPWTVHLLCG